MTSVGNLIDRLSQHGAQMQVQVMRAIWSPPIDDIGYVAAIVEEDDVVRIVVSDSDDPSA